MYFYAARQPILDRNKELIGYELLFRDGVDNVFPNIDGDEATSRLIEGSQFNFGLEDLTDNKPAYINFTLDTLLKGYPTLLNKDGVVIEILETVQPGKRLLAIVKDLKEKGYTLALDDYAHQPVWRHFYPFIDIIKIDFLKCDIEIVKALIEDLKPYPHIKLLAEKVETYELYNQAFELGFRVSSLSDFIDPQVWSTFQSGNQQVILGKGVAELLNVDKGDYLTLMLPTNGPATKVQAPKRVRVQVAGLLTLNGQIDHNLALIPLADAQSYAKLGQGVTGVAVKVTDVLQATQIVREAGNTLNDYVYLRSWQQKFGFLYRDIQLVRTIMYLVMVLVIGVASFNIVSTLMMAVKDRAGEIAILRTMGASDGLVKRIFVWQGVFSGVLGSIAGSVTGVVVALNLTPMISVLEQLIGHQFLSGDIYFVDFLPSQVAWMDVVLVSSTAIGLSLMATWYPASRASRLNPAAVLSAK